MPSTCLFSWKKRIWTASSSDFFFSSEKLLFIFKIFYHFFLWFFVSLFLLTKSLPSSCLKTKQTRSGSHLLFFLEQSTVCILRPQLICLSVVLELKQKVSQFQPTAEFRKPHSLSEQFWQGVKWVSEVWQWKIPVERFPVVVQKSHPRHMCLHKFC